MPAPLPYFLSTFGEELQSLRRNWFWLLLLGIFLILVGFVAITYPLVATLTTVELFGVLMLIGGVAQIISGIWTRRWGGFFVNLLCGLMTLFVGVVFLERPLTAAVGFTLLLAMFFLATGAIRIVIAFAQRFSGWGWTVLSGVISLFLGLLIWQNLFASALWVIGTFVGIDLIFNGWSWVMLGLAAKTIPEAGTTQLKGT